MRNRRTQVFKDAMNELDMSCRESCGSCGADLEPSTVFVWHYDWEDCRAIKDPIPEPLVP